MVYSLLVFITDYSLFLSTLFLFFKKGKVLATEVKNTQVVINEIETENELEEEAAYFERRRSSSTGSIKDYILYST